MIGIGVIGIDVIGIDVIGVGMAGVGIGDGIFGKRLLRVLRVYDGNRSAANEAQGSQGR